MKKIIVLFLIILVTALTGCSANLAAASSGMIGCPEQEITITDDKPNHWNGNRTWVANCRGNRFFCNVTRTNGTTAIIACTPELKK